MKDNVVRLGREIAKSALAAISEERDKQSEKAGRDLTVSQALNYYIAEYARANARASLEQIEIARDYVNAHFLPGKTVASIVDTDIDYPYDPRNRKSGKGYIQRRRNCELVLKRSNPMPAGNGTIRRELGTLAAAINYAVRKKRIAESLVPRIPVPPAPPPRDLWLRPEQEKALVAAMPQPAEGFGRLTRPYRFVLLGLDTAARKGALETLTWFQVDFHTGLINLNPRGRIQTKKRRAIVPMSGRLRFMLERAYREKTSGWVLDHSGSIRASMETLTTKTRMEWVTPHVFRHTWATRAARNGVEMVDIADFLGDDLRTVEKNYRHHSPHFLKGAADWREREREMMAKPSPQNVHRLRPHPDQDDA